MEDCKGSPRNPHLCLYMVCFSIYIYLSIYTHTYIYIYIRISIGWWLAVWSIFSIYFGNHHPNGLSYFFPEGVFEPPTTRMPLTSWRCARTDLYRCQQAVGENRLEQNQLGNWGHRDRFTIEKTWLNGG